MQQIQKQLMTDTEARKCIDRINLNVRQAGAFLLDFRDREGWKALGYDSFKACCQKEFAELYGQRSHIYRLMQQEEVSARVSDATDSPKQLPIAATRELAKLPEAEQVPAYQEAVAETGPAAPFFQTVRNVVARRQAAQAPEKPEPTEELSPAYRKALDRIQTICGKAMRQAIEDGTLAEVTEREAILYARLKDSEMADAQELIITKRWAPSRAHRFLQRMPGPEMRIGDLINHAIAEGGEWTGTINGFEIVVRKQGRRR